jgi:hypothetical protein
MLQVTYYSGISRCISPPMETHDVGGFQYLSFYLTGPRTILYCGILRVMQSAVLLSCLLMLIVLIL